MPETGELPGRDNMTPERTIEQKQVDRVVTELRNSVPVRIPQITSITEHGLGGIPPLAKITREIRMDVGNQAPIGGSEPFGPNPVDALRTEQERLAVEEYRRHPESAPGNRFEQMIYTDTDPKNVMYATRRFLYSTEQNLGVFDQYSYRRLKTGIDERIILISDSLNNRLQERLPGLKQYPALVAPEKLEESLRILYPDEEQRKKALTVMESRYPNREQRQELLETMKLIKDEVSAFEDVFVATVLYRQTRGSLEAMADLMKTAAYSGVTISQLRTIFRSEASIPGETPFGRKIDMAMRAYVLVGLGGGDRKVMRKNPTTGRDEEIDPSTQLKEAYKKQPDYFKNAFSEAGLSTLAERNIICAPPKDDPRARLVEQDVRGAIRAKLGEDAFDNEAAERWGWDFIYMFGVAAYLDNRKKGDISGRPEPNGSNGRIGSDDLVKVMYMKSHVVDKEGRQGYPDAPDAIKDQLPYSLVKDFLHFNGKPPVWQRWFENGTELKDIDWDPSADGSWWYYTYILFNAGKEKGGVFQLLTQPLWRMDDLFNDKVMPEINKTIDKVVVAGGIRNQDGSYCYTKITGSSDREKQLRIKEQKERLWELICIAAITSTYQVRGATEGWKEIGIKEWQPSVFKGVGEVVTKVTKDNMERVQRTIKESGVEINWSIVIRESRKFLESRGVF